MGMSSKSKPQGKQVNLFPEKGENYVAKGPIFDRQAHSGKRYLLIVAIVAIVGIAGFFGIKRWSRTPSPVNQPATISQTVMINDSQTKLARQALATYLGQQPDITLSNAQKLFIETTLAQAHKIPHLTVGSSVEFQISEIASLITQSQNLTASQIQKWSELARGVKF